MATSYLNYAEQQMQNTFQGSPIYRKSSYIQAGGTPVNKPTTIGLENMYGGQTPAIGSAFSVPQTITTTPNLAVPFSTSTYLPTYQTPDFSQAMEQQGWVKQLDEYGVEHWYPANPQEGEYFQTSDGATWQYNGQKWVKTTSDIVNAEQYKFDVQKSADWAAEFNRLAAGSLITSYGYLGTLGIGSAEDVLWGLITGDLNAQDIQIAIQNSGGDLVTRGGMTSRGGKISYEQLKDVIDWAAQANVMVKNLSALNINIDKNQYINAILNGDADGYIQSLANQSKAAVDANSENGMLDFNKLIKAQSETGALKLYDNLVTTTENLSNQILSGDLDLSDIQNLINSDNPVESWLGDVLEKSYDTGYYQGTYQEQLANPDSPLNTLIQNYEENLAVRHEEAMKYLRLSAIQRGHSTSDVMYNQALEGIQAGMAMEAANNIAQTIITDMESQYQFIGNAITDLIRETQGEAQAQTFSNNLSQAWENAKLEYEMGIQDLAQEIADYNAQSQGDFISGIVGFVSSIIGGILG